jgi:hypothetical protein
MQRVTANLSADLVFEIVSAMGREILQSSASADSPRRLRKLLFRAIAVTAGLIVGLAIAEAGLRLVGYSSPEFYQADEILGYSLTPNVSGWYRKEGRTFVQINSDGFRDVEHSVEKPPGVYRIAVVGDSYVEALQVEQDEVFSTFVRQTLAGCVPFGDRRPEILNFGVSGYGTAQELLMLREKVWKYEPDMVLLLMTTNNDITDNLREFKRTSIPYFTIKAGGLALDDSFRSERSFAVKYSALGRMGNWFKQHLRIVQGIGEASIKIKYRYRQWREKKLETAAAQDETVQPVSDLGIDNQIYIPPTDDNWRTAWNVTEAILLQMNVEASMHDSRLVIVTGSNGVQVLPSIEMRKRFTAMIGAEDLYYPDRRIAEFCRANSITAITLAPQLADHAARNAVFLHGFENNLGYGHWNKTGHRVVGELLGSRLCEMSPGR